MRHTPPTSSRKLQRRLMFRGQTKLLLSMAEHNVPTEVRAFTSSKGVLSVHMYDVLFVSRQSRVNHNKALARMLFPPCRCCTRHSCESAPESAPSDQVSETSESWHKPVGEEFWASHRRHTLQTKNGACVAPPGGRQRAAAAAAAAAARGSIPVPPPGRLESRTDSTCYYLAAAGGCSTTRHAEGAAGGTGPGAEAPPAGGALPPAGGALPPAPRPPPDPHRWDG
jgi:hypothetical protein